jgi:hypothetical protein
MKYEIQIPDDQQVLQDANLVAQGYDPATVADHPSNVRNVGDNPGLTTEQLVAAGHTEEYAAVHPVNRDVIQSKLAARADSIDAATPEVPEAPEVIAPTPLFTKAEDPAPETPITPAAAPEAEAPESFISGLSDPAKEDTVLIAAALARKQLAAEAEAQRIAAADKANNAPKPAPIVSEKGTVLLPSEVPATEHK